MTFEQADALADLVCELTPATAMPWMVADGWEVRATESRTVRHMLVTDDVANYIRENFQQ